MDDLMLHVLDIAMNAVGAGARTLKIVIREGLAAGRLHLVVADNGPGMSAELVQRVITEYATTKAKSPGWVGFGLALLRGTCELVGGEFELLSRPGCGTLVRADLPASHPDLPPLGQVAETLQPLLMGCPGTDLCFEHRVGSQSWRLDTRTVRRVMGDSYGSPLVRRWLMDQVRSNERDLVVGRVVP